MILGVLCSGSLGLIVLKYLKGCKKIAFVCTDSKSSDIIEYCKANSVLFFVGNPRGGKIDSFLEGKYIDILVSVNYLFIIESNLITFPKKLAFNVHGSLLPKYRGRTPHVWSIINNESVAGVTAHIIDDGCDTGDIIVQKTILISQHDTGASLLRKYEHSYIPIIEEVLKKVEIGAVQLTKQDVTRASYFGKRTAADGLINWNWQKERIRNWVRAQAYPYPGAFTYVDNKKVIIDKVVFSDFGFFNDEPNGLIKATDPILIKTPNGVIAVVEIREGSEYLKKGKIAQS